jgi:catechol 2,3-dioxygenase-like lactoylglutathione lyase family enzyme
MIAAHANSIRQKCLAVICVLLLVAARALAQSPEPIGLQSVDRVELIVADMERSARFFCEVLEFEIMSDSTDRGAELSTSSPGAAIRQVDLRLGDEQVRLTQYLNDPGQPMPADSRANDHWFQHIAIIVSDMDKAYEKFRRFKVRHASSAPQTLPASNPNAAGIKAFYFRDPDGHFLEILQFPPDKGDAKWHRQDQGRLFLGIDHTAIVVADTDASLRIYRDALGFRIAGTSENLGFEQEHLNGVFGAHLKITTLRAPSGMGIELLEYLSPTDGRALTTEIRPNDIACWQIHVRSDRLPDSAISASSAITQTNPLPSSVRLDPDGHALHFLTTRE